MSVWKIKGLKFDTYSTYEVSHGRYELIIHLVSDVANDLFDFGFYWKKLKELCTASPFSEGITARMK